MRPEHAIDVADDKSTPMAVSSKTLKVGCSAIVLCALGFIAVIVGLFMWDAASMTTKDSTEFRNRGSQVDVVVVDKSTARSTGSTRAGTSSSQFYLHVQPVDSSLQTAEPRRLPVSHAEYDDARDGDRMNVWKLDDHYTLDRVVRAAPSTTAGLIALIVGTCVFIPGMIMLIVTARRVFSS